LYYCTIAAFDNDAIKEATYLLTISPLIKWAWFHMEEGLSDVWG